jgi:ribosomal silencing factor RsfS
VASLADYVTKTLAENGVGDAHVEGAATADWVLVDSFQVIVHLFRPEVRAFYNLERMWDVPAPAPTTPEPTGRRHSSAPQHHVHVGGFAGQMA